MIKTRRPTRYGGIIELAGCEHCSPIHAERLRQVREITLETIASLYPLAYKYRLFLLTSSNTQIDEKAYIKGNCVWRNASQALRSLDHL